VLRVADALSPGHPARTVSARNGLKTVHNRQGGRGPDPDDDQKTLEILHVLHGMSRGGRFCIGK
jgi:hypothetical protein